MSLWCEHDDDDWKTEGKGRGNGPTKQGSVTLADKQVPTPEFSFSLSYNASENLLTEVVSSTADQTI